MAIRLKDKDTQNQQKEETLYCLLNRNYNIRAIFNAVNEKEAGKP